jgi:hypothetical protein
MSKLGRRIRTWWGELGTAARMWWAGAGAVALAAVLALGATTLTDAAPQSSGGDAASATVTTTTTPSRMGSMPGMSKGTPAGSSAAGSTPAGSSAAGSATTAAAICPNVKNTMTMGNGMVMAPVPSGAPTAAEQAAANTLVTQTAADVAKYQSLSAATAAGYVPATNPSGYEVHYADWQTVRSGDVLDPNHPSSLVYANTVKGPVLLGAMYLGAGPCIPGPDVGGPLTQWHAHDDLCLSTTHQVVGKSNAAGDCTTGVHNTNTYFMLHVWVIPALATTHQFQPDLTRAELAPIIRTGQ